MAVTITRTPWVDDDGTGTTGTVINNAVKTSLYTEIDTALTKVAQLAGGNILTGTQIVNAELWINAASNPNGGQVLVGVTASGHPNGIVVANLVASPMLNYCAFLSSTGVAGLITQVTASTVAYNTSSDARLKDDDGAAVDLDGLRGIVVHDFRWKADGGRDRGVFAQEAHRVFPRAIGVGTDDRTDAGHLAHPWMTDYSKFVPDLIVGWQQHDAELRALRLLLAGVTP